MSRRGRKLLLFFSGGNASVSNQVATLATPSVDLDAASDSGSFSTDNITNVNTPNFTTAFTGNILVPDGFLQNDVLHTSVNGSEQTPHTITALEAGGATISLGYSALSDGANSIVQWVIRGAEFSAHSTPLVVTVDTTNPTINTASANFPENSALAVTLSANETVTWAITGGADQAKFTLVAGVLGMVAKNFESPDDADTNGTYVVQVTATDVAGNTTAKTLTYTLTDVNEAPTVANALVNQTATAGSAFSYTFASNTFADVDAGDTKTYSVVSGMPGWMSFDGVRTFSGTPNAGGSDNGVVTIVVRDTDSGGLSVTSSFTVTTSSSSNSLLTGLTSYWKMDEASGDVLDATASANTLTSAALPTSAAGIISTARSFAKASSQYVGKADNASLSTGDIDFSISCWLKFSTKSIGAGIIGKWTTGFEYLLYYNQSTDRLEFYVSSTGSGGGIVGVTASNFGSVTTGVWLNVVAWHDSVNNLLGISVNNGTANTTSHSAGVFDGTMDFRIGWVDSTGVEKFDGLIDEVGFWKKTLSSGDRTTLYGGGSGLSYSSFS